MFDINKKCPLCGMEMEYRPNRLWTGMRYQTNVHEWYCWGDVEKERPMHTLKLYEMASQEFKDWEKNQ